MPSRRAQHALDELRRYTGEDYLQRPEVRAALAEQGLDIPEQAGAGVGEETGSIVDLGGPREAGATDDGETSVTPETDTLAELRAAQDELADTHAARLEADRLRRTKPKTLRAKQQAAADTRQEAEGLARREALERQAVLRARLNALADRVGALPTPGGITFPLLILLILLLVLRPVNGNPPLVWLWLVITRKARLIPETALPEAGGGHPPETAQGAQGTRSTQGTQGTQGAPNGTAALVGVAPILDTAALSGLGRYIHE